MSALENTGDLVKEDEPVINGLWGVAQIAPVIGRTERQTNHMLAAGHITCARKIGGIWFANRDALLREFGGA